MDNSDIRKDVFASVVEQSPLIRTCYVAYSYCPAPIQALLLLAYGLKCYLSLAWTRSIDSKLTFFGSYPTELKALSALERGLSDLSTDSIDIGLRNCFKLSNLRDLPVFLALVPRLYRYALRLARSLSFMPACRVFSTLPYYVRSIQLLRRSRSYAICIASHYAPEAVGLAAAAHRCGRRVIYTNHANATGQHQDNIPVNADLVAVTSRAVADSLERASRRRLNIVMVSMPLARNQLHIPDATSDSVRVCVYLTALTNRAAMIDLVQALEKDARIATIGVRPHPQEVVNVDLSVLAQISAKVWLSQDRELVQDFERTDVAICGNSTVVIELLRFGIPVAYNSLLDKLSYDFAGYVGAGLIPDATDATEHNDLLDSLKQHYGTHTWIRTMQYFDAGYRQAPATLESELNERVHSLLNANPWGDRCG